MFDRETEGRVAQAEISVFDAMMAEIMGDKQIRMRKFERTHHADNSKKDKTKADRKRDKKIRMRKMYGLDAFEDTKFGKTVFYWDVKGGQKKFPEYEAEILRNLKDAELEKSAYAELLGDPEHYVGKSTLTKRRDRIWAEMQKIADDFCKMNGYQWGEAYAYDPKDHLYHVYYPEKFYNLQSDMLVIESIMHDQYIKKVAKGTVDKPINPAEIVDYIESHMEWAIAEYGKEEVRNILYRFRELAKEQKERVLK